MTPTAGCASTVGSTKGCSTASPPTPAACSLSATGPSHWRSTRTTAATAGSGKPPRNGYFTIQLGIPSFDSPEGLRRLFAARIQWVAEAENEFAALEQGIYPIPAITVRESDVFEDGFDTLLHEYYEASEQNLRAVLTVAQQALLGTVGMGEDVVTTASLREAALALAI